MTNQDNIKVTIGNGYIYYRVNGTWICREPEGQLRGTLVGGYDNAHNTEPIPEEDLVLLVTYKLLQ